ncbi:MAG: CPBP family intramembrane metalloprotease [Verrucomicrobia bacterium]|nr:CPBP family intramembrane metalloprotease [Verrucomicrobiota bacterium]
MQNGSWLQILMLGAGLYVAKLWLDDFRAQRSGSPNPRGLPGATPASVGAVAIAALGGFIIVAAETWGEKALGISGEQSKMTGLFAAYTLVAALIEEIIFRGYIVLDKRGRLTLWASVLGASLLFTALHPFLWQWEGGLPWNDGQLNWTLGLKGWFSSAAVFVGSLWFYFVRFAPFNPQRSLLPCFAAHASKNIGVIAVKAAQGFLSGWF